MTKVCEWETGGYYYSMYSLGQSLILIIEEEQITRKKVCSVYKKIE